VEYNPVRDRDLQTAMAAAKVLKEIAAAMLRRGNPPSGGWV
jgi:arginase family enzyme